MTQRMKRANLHPCEGGCGTIVGGNRKYCPVCSCRVIAERTKAYQRRQTQERRAFRDPPQAEAQP